MRAGDTLEVQPTIVDAIAELSGNCNTEAYLTGWVLADRHVDHKLRRYTPGVDTFSPSLASCCWPGTASIWASTCVDWGGIRRAIEGKVRVSVQGNAVRLR